jgi:pimeloyl-ACP methyl ester carboxylesterase
MQMAASALRPTGSPFAGWNRVDTAIRQRVAADAWNDYRDDVRGRGPRVGGAAVSPGLSAATRWRPHRHQYAAHSEGLRVIVGSRSGRYGGSRFTALLPVLSRLVPSMPINPKLDLSRLTRDPDLQRAYVADPLYQTRVTPRIAAELLRAIADTRELAPGFRVPLLIMHGTADTFTSPEGSREFYERAGFGDKTYKTYEGAYHNLFVEANREEVYDDIAAWIDART